MQPLTALIGWGVMGLDLLIRFGREGISSPAAWFKLRRADFHYLLIMAAFSLPLIFYSSISFLTDPFLKAWTTQNNILSPPLTDYLMAYFIWIPLCLLGAMRVIRQRQERFYPLLGWILVLPILAYFPVAIQRRLPEGSWAALIAVGLAGLAALQPKVQKIVRLTIWTSLLGSMILFLGSFLTLAQRSSPVFLPYEEIQAFEYLRQVAKSTPVVLASFDTSNAVPAWAPVRTIIGHGPESIRLAQIQPRVEAFYHADLTSVEETQLLQEFQVGYVIWGPEERDLGNRNPAAVPGLKLVFQNTTYQIFEVNP
jgi:hypothetical protein